MNFKLSDPEGKTLTVCRRCLFHIFIDSTAALEKGGPKGGTLLWMITATYRACESDACSEEAGEEQASDADRKTARALPVN